MRNLTGVKVFRIIVDLGFLRVLVVVAAGCEYAVAPKLKHSQSKIACVPITNAQRFKCIFYSIGKRENSFGEYCIEC